MADSPRRRGRPAGSRGLGPAVAIAESALYNNGKSFVDGVGVTLGRWRTVCHRISGSRFIVDSK